MSDIANVGQTGGADRPARAFDAASAALDAVAGVDKMIASLSAVRARLVAHAYDAVLAEQRAIPVQRTPHAKAELARQTLVTELAPLLRITPTAAAHLLAESRALATTLPATLEALGRGEFSYRHAQVVVDHAALLPDDGVAPFEQAVLADARILNVARFRDRARRIRERTHPDSLARRRARQFDRRSVSVDPAADGMAWLTAYLPAETAVAIDDRLDRLAVSLRDPNDVRSFTQLRADAFCDLMLRGEVDGIQRGLRANVLVTVPVLTLLGHDDEPASLEGYGPIPAEVARLLAADATGFTRLLTHPETGVVLSVGRDRYTVPAGMRLWLRARDETCRMVGCGRRASVSDVDHGHSWGEGGITAGDNLAHLCRGDHTRKHSLGWRIKHLSGGVVRWTSPMGRSYLTQPSMVMRT
jgi:hypothetical protein